MFRHHMKVKVMENEGKIPQHSSSQNYTIMSESPTTYSLPLFFRWFVLCGFHIR